MAGTLDIQGIAVRRPGWQSLPPETRLQAMLYAWQTGSPLPVDPGPLAEILSVSPAGGTSPAITDAIRKRMPDGYAITAHFVATVDRRRVGVLVRVDGPGELPSRWMAFERDGKYMATQIIPARMDSLRTEEC